MEHSELHRAMAADTLAYLTEVDSELQQIAAISNQLVIALMELLKCQSITGRGAAFRYETIFGTKNNCFLNNIFKNSQFLPLGNLENF